jgi:shikimate kinase
MTERRHVVLVGMMGAGKTTVGRAAAERLGVPFVDVDHEIERQQGRTVSTIFADDGEAAFRGIERSVLADVLSRPTRSIVAAGGGAVLDEVNREQMRAHGVVIWLRAQADELFRRVGERPGRPLLDASESDRAQRIEELVTCREAAYHQVAHDVIDVDHLSVDDVVAQLVQFVESKPRMTRHGERP